MIMEFNFISSILATHLLPDMVGKGDFVCIGFYSPHNINQRYADMPACLRAKITSIRGLILTQFSSVQFSHSVMSDSL